MMLKSKKFYIIMTIAGICFIGLSMVMNDLIPQSFSGILIGIGAGLFGMGIANYIMKVHEDKHPQIMKQNEIAFKDERNTIIRYRAKAKAADITQWLIMAIAYLTIAINAPLWVTLATVAVFLIYNILGLYFMAKFEHEM